MIYSNQKKPKGVIRNEERKMGIMKLVEAFTKFVENASEISHNAAKQKTRNFTTWINGTADGFTDLLMAEDNYTHYDKAEEEEKIGLEEKKNN